MGNHSMFLFGRPSALEGASRILDFAGVLSTYNVTQNGQQADYRALAADWAAIGLDIRQSIELHHSEQPSPTERSE